MTDLIEDGDAYWMTSNQGLFEWSANDLSVLKHFTVHDGLPDQYLYGMLPAGDGTWWISSNNGLAHFDPVHSSFSNHTTSDGLQSKEFNSRAAFRSASGRLYFGGVNGFNHFLPADVQSDPDTACVRLIGLTVQDSAVDLRSFGTGSLIQLPYGHNAVRIDLAVLEFTAPEHNAYRYRIRGYVDWTTLPPDRPITLTNMPAGDYVVEVTGINGHGLLSVPFALLRIRVPLPFWASPWAYVLAGSLLVAIVAVIGFLLYRRSVKRRLAHNEQQLKELRVRTRIAQDLHDDVGSGLARIAALGRMAEKRTNRGDASTEQVSKMGAISQELMDNLRDVVWVNDPRNGDLADLLLRLKEHVRDLFEPNGVSCAFAFPEPLPERAIGSTYKRNVFLIMKEATHNAWKYSGAAQLDLSYTVDDHGFTCILRDHGAGLGNGAVRGSGHGLANMQQRALELGAALTITNAPGGGTEVRLAGPLSCLHL
jgi:signal transduction histidine kinase